MTAGRDTRDVKVRIWPAAPGWATSIDRGQKPYGRVRDFDTLPAALIHCAQMLRVLADEVTREAGK